MQLNEFFTPYAHGGRFPGRFRYGQGLGHRRRHPRFPATSLQTSMRDAALRDTTGTQLKEEFGLFPRVAQKGVGKAFTRYVGAKKGVAKAFAPYLKRQTGISPEKTCWIQTILNKEGENLKVDGIYGPLTKDATRRFQGRNSLRVDGIVGPQTETALIQAALNQIAQASVLPVNGIMDARTRQEIKRFQSSKSLVVDGIVGPKTRAAMVTALGGQCLVRSPAPYSPAPHKPAPHKPAPYYQVRCDRPAYERQLGLCNQDTERCLREALEDLGVKVGLGCLAAAVAGLARGGAQGALVALAACGVGASAALYITLKRCDEALKRCRDLARQQTNCS